MSGIDATFMQCLEEIPETVRAFAGRLPYELGLVAKPEGKFSEFMRFEPNQNLPNFAAHPLVPGGATERNCRAHHLALIFGLIADRLADAQVMVRPELLFLRRLFLHRWVADLRGIMGTEQRARIEIATSLRRWRRGIQSETRAYREGALTAASYADCVSDKLDIMSVVTRCVLRNADKDLARAFEDVYHLFLAALQCWDDAVDAREDRARGSDSVAALLGTKASVLFRVAPLLVANAAARARCAGFASFAEWLGHLFNMLDGWQPVNHTLIDEGRALQIAFEIEGQLANEAEVPETNDAGSQGVTHVEA